MSRGHVVVLFAISALATIISSTGARGVMITAPLLLSVFLMGTEDDFKSLAKKYTAAGYPSKAQAKTIGASGVAHNFDLTVSKTNGELNVVSDAALSVADVEETKVLAFYAKVYDVKPKFEVLCVSPKLKPAAAELAKQYRMVVLENERPSELVGMLERTVDKFLGLS